MGFDALFLRCLNRELRDGLIGARIEKIQQPARGTVVLTVKGEARRDLMIGGSSGAPRIHFTAAGFEKPREPPMFCMLLRKHLTGARILDLTMPATDRVLVMRLAAPGMFGEGEERGLVAELIGHAANLILTDGEGIITDCLYRSGSAEDRRALQPGMRYRLPPMQDKRELLELDDGEIAQITAGFPQGKPLDRCVLETFLGISPPVAREIAFRAGGGDAARELSALRDAVLSGGEPYLLLDPQGRPFDFSYIPILQYGKEYTLQRADSYSKLLDAFFAGRDAMERRRQRSGELRRTVVNAKNRVERRLAAQRQELLETEDRDRLRECGDIITANIYAMKKGQRELAAEDFYSESGGIRKIPLDPMKTPQQNAAKYYKDYNRAKSAAAHLTERIASGENELSYLESVIEELELAETEEDLAEIRSELEDAGYLRAPKQAKRVKRRPSRPMTFRSGAGFIIRAGRNNTQNDALTLKESAKTDLWLHASGMHGSHVVIACEGAEPDPQTVEEAASIAAWYSKGRASAKVPVDVTQIRQIKKPPNSRPGTVIYHTYRTIMAIPDESLVEKLKIK